MSPQALVWREKSIRGLGRVLTFTGGLFNDILVEKTLHAAGGIMGKTREATAIEVKVGLSLKDLIAALRRLSDEDREFFIENLLAATSPEYLRSIEEAREDYKAGRTVPWEEAFQATSRPE